MNMTNEELQTAIDSLLKHFNLRERWFWNRAYCGTHAPDGATSDALASLLYEQAKRADTNEQKAN